jgi:quinoprotein relay system zinc metallohydrolase 1
MTFKQPLSQGVSSSPRRKPGSTSSAALLKRWIPGLKGMTFFIMISAWLSSYAHAAPRSYGLTPVLIAPDTYVFAGKLEHFTRANGGNILNPGFIVTDEGVVVIQAGPSRLFGEEMRAAIRKVTPRPIIRVFVSNQHPDYFLGAQAFKGVPVTALPATIKGIEREGPGMLDAMYRLTGDWMAGTELTVPTEPVRVSVMEIGKHRLRLLALDGHTPGDLAIFDETTGVLFAGGLAFADRAPTTPHADIPRWLSALEVLAALPIRTLVPNHGTIRNDASAIGETRDYLTWLDAFLRAEAAAGKDMAEVLNAPLPQRFAGWAVGREEYLRSVAHLWPKIEESVLTRRK